MQVLLSSGYSLEMDKAAEAFIKFREIIAKLRNPVGGCPWDIEQTHESLKPFLLEETYEALEAIDSNKAALCGELGDVLLQIFLHSQIASESKSFDIGDVIEGISTKIVARHPHVFSDTVAKTAAEVKENWEKIKKKDLKANESVLDSVPKALPACARAQRLGEKAAAIGFDWKKSSDVKDKIREEVIEYLETSPKSREAAEEFGDLLFSLIQYGRKEGINAEEALSGACRKFQTRFRKVEVEAGSKMKDMSLEALETLWQKAKE